MIVGNKAAMLSFKFPNTLMLMQNGFTVLFLLGNMAFKTMEFKKFTLKQFQIFAVTACCTAAQIGSSFMAR